MLNDFALIPFNKLSINDFKSAYIKTHKNQFLEITVLFTNLKVDPSSVPIGYYVYEILRGDNGKAVALSKEINSSRFGTIITRQFYENLDNNLLSITKFRYANNQITNSLFNDITDSYNKAKNSF